MPANDRLEYNLSALAIHFKPIVMVCIRNSHSPLSPPAFVPAIIDSGADICCFPVAFAQAINHIFDRGQPQRLSGIGGTTSCMEHGIDISVIGPSWTIRDAFLAKRVQIDDIVAAPISVRAQVMPGLQNFGLLGCHDFLKNWDFHLQVTDSAFSLIPRSVDCRKAVAEWHAKHPAS